MHFLILYFILNTCQNLGAEGFTSDEDHEMLSRIEKQLKRRFPIGNQVSEQNIVKDFVKQAYPERAIYKVIHTMIRRGELQHRMQRKMLYRLHWNVITFFFAFCIIYLFALYICFHFVLYFKYFQCINMHTFELHLNNLFFYLGL